MRSVYLESSSTTHLFSKRINETVSQLNLNICGLKHRLLLLAEYFIFYWVRSLKLVNISDAIHIGSGYRMYLISWL